MSKGLASILTCFFCYCLLLNLYLVAMPEINYLPLRWESTGDQWWYASPVDWAAANGHYDVVRELLHLDSNLLIKLTSLRRIKRLETVWEDDVCYVDAAKCRSSVARNLFLECEMKKGRNSLIRAGYGGWLLYSAASAGDTNFVQELLQRYPLLVFGEGEYGVTDIFYAAARSRNAQVFRLLFDYAAAPRCSVGCATGGSGQGPEKNVKVFRWEMVNRAVHGAARGGNLEMLKELIQDGSLCSDILAYRDLQGSTILHTASGKGQVEVVKYLVTSFDIINSKDNQGNTSLHVAAFRGHLSVIKTLLMASPLSSTATNNAGDTFLHMAVAGFRTPGFRRLDKQMDLMKKLISGNILSVEEIINARNNHGRTILHMAVFGNVLSDLVELLMRVPSINLNIRDVDGMTPLDLLRQHPRSASSEILIKQLVSAGGTSNFKNHTARSVIASQLKMHGVRSSPGTSFRISDAEIFLHTGIEVSETSGRASSSSSISKSEQTHSSIVNDSTEVTSRRKERSVNNAANKVKVFLQWPHMKKKKKTETPKKIRDDESFESLKRWIDPENTPTPLRHRFSKATSLANNKRTLSVRNAMPTSPALKKKYTAGLMHGVVQAMPHLATAAHSPRSIARSSISSSPLDKQKGIYIEKDIGDASSSSNPFVGDSAMSNMAHKARFRNSRRMNKYFCFGAHRTSADGSILEQEANRGLKLHVPPVA